MRTLPRRPLRSIRCPLLTNAVLASRPRVLHGKTVACEGAGHGGSLRGCVQALLIKLNAGLGIGRGDIVGVLRMVVDDGFAFPVRFGSDPRRGWKDPEA